MITKGQVNTGYMEYHAVPSAGTVLTWQYFFIKPIVKSIKVVAMTIKQPLKSQALLSWLVHASR